MQEAVFETCDMPRRASAGGRIFYLDNLRTFIVCVVVVFHAALAFMVFCPDWWPVADPQQNLFFTGVVLLTDVPIMPILFMLAGYFGLASLSRKGQAEFWRDKCWRIVAPWLLGILIVAPLTPYFWLLSHLPDPPTYLYFLTNLYLTPQFNTQGALWFLGVLTVFYAGLSLAWWLYRPLGVIADRGGRPSAGFWWVFTAVISIGFLFINTFWYDFQWVPVKYVLWVKPTRVPVELSFFILGVHAYRRQWFAADGYRPNPVLWLPIAVVTGAVFFVYKMWVGFLMPELWMRAGHAALHCFFCVATTLALLGLFRTYADRTNAFLARSSAGSFGVYWIHMPIVFFFNLLIRGYDWNIYVKYTVVSVLALAVCHLVAVYGLIRLPIFSPRKARSAVAVAAR